MFKKKQIHMGPDLLGTERAARMFAAPPKVANLAEIRDTGTVEPCFEKVQRMLRSETRQLGYLKTLCELWHAVHEADIDVRRVIVFDGPDDFYDRVRLICGKWLPFPAMPRPVLATCRRRS